MKRPIILGTLLFVVLVAATTRGQEKKRVTTVPPAQPKTDELQTAEPTRVDMETRRQSATASDEVVRLLVLFDSDEDKQNETRDDFEQFRIEVVKAKENSPLVGKRVYGSRDIKSAADWAEATTVGSKVDLTRNIEEKDLTNYRLRIEKTDAWNTRVSAIAIAEDGVESFLFPQKAGTPDASNHIFEWKLPVLEQLREKDDESKVLNILRVTLFNYPQQHELTLEVVHDRRVLGKYIIARPWQREIATRGGLPIILPETRTVREQVAHKLFMRIYPSTGGKPNVEPIDSEPNSLLEAEVIGIAEDDQVESFLVPKQPGKPSQDLKEEIEAKEDIVDSKLDRIDDLKEEIDDADDEEIKSRLQMELKELESEVKKLEKELAELNATRDRIEFDGRSSLYWEFQKID